MKRSPEMALELVSVMTAFEVMKIVRFGCAMFIVSQRIDTYNHPCASRYCCERSARTPRSNVACNMIRSHG